MFIDVFVDPNPNCPEGCGLRFKAEDEPRAVAAVRYHTGPGEAVECDVAGWSSACGGSACAAHAVTVEDSGGGAATLIYGGDWGLRLTPKNGGPAFGEPYLTLDAANVLG